MGQSTNALLWFGVAIDGSPDDGDELPEKIHDIINGKDGDLYGDGREWLEEHDLIDEVEFVKHCSGEYPMYGIAVKTSLKTATRGHPISVMTSSTPLAFGVWKALELLGEDSDDHEIGWYLASMWN